MIKITKENFEKISKLAREKRLTGPKIKKLLNCGRDEADLYRDIFYNQEGLREIFGDNDLISENVKLAKSKQLYQDSNRIERKAFRDYARMENALVALNKAVLDKFEEIDFKIGKHKTKIEFVEGDQAIIQLSDTHFNELVDLEDNRYDFEVASKRMALFAMEAKRVLSSYGIKKVVLAMTGDMINSDRRLDEKLNMSTNRMTAAMISTNLIQYFIQDLMEEFDMMDVVYVTGNESRAFEMGFTDMVVTDNYDSIIFNMLRLIFKKSENVNFILSNPVETVINVNGKNVLLFHGTTLGAAAQGNVQKFIGKYAGKGIVIDYALFGHIHFCNIGDIFARSGSLVGSNTYSDMALGLITKPSQNIHIIKKDGTINNVRFELKNIDNIKGYPIRNDLDAYNAKSASKAHRQYKVIEIEKSR